MAESGEVCDSWPDQVKWTQLRFKFILPLHENMIWGVLIIYCPNHRASVVRLLKLRLGSFTQKDSVFLLFLSFFWFCFVFYVNLTM